MDVPDRPAVPVPPLLISNNRIIMSRDTASRIAASMRQLLNFSLFMMYVGHIPYLGIDEEQSIESGTVPTTVDTTQHAWDFCSHFSLEVKPEL